MIQCEKCGNSICSDKPIKCPFCGKSFETGPVMYCPTCSAPVSGNECYFCGDELYGGSSFYQDYIEQQIIKNQKK